RRPRMPNCVQQSLSARWAGRRRGSRAGCGRRHILDGEERCPEHAAVGANLSSKDVSYAYLRGDVGPARDKEPVALADGAGVERLDDDIGVVGFAEPEIAGLRGQADRMAR